MSQHKPTNLSSCRICLESKKSLCPLFKYKLTGNYAEMLTAIADVKVAANDGLPDKICPKCCTALEKAYLLKTMAERTDRRLRKKLINTEGPVKKISFDSLLDIKSEIGPLNVKNEPKWEMEIDLSGTATETNILNKDIVIANTVIRKCDSQKQDRKDDFFDEGPNISWKSLNTVKGDNSDVEFLDDNFFQDDDDRDEDYSPPKAEKKKPIFKKPVLLPGVKVLKVKKNKVQKRSSMCKIKVLQADSSNKNTNLITCYPVSKSGTKGSPILLKRPKDGTVLKFHPNYKSRAGAGAGAGGARPDGAKIRIVRSVAGREAAGRTKEKLVCPVCGILTYTLGNHMNTHQEKKRYNCTECSKSFSQRSNLQTHMKYHAGVKDHVCEVCGAGFYCAKGLIRHNLIHTGERPYACTLCPKRFIARCDLNRHMRIHSGYKPYKCAACAMSFNAKHQLQNHERMHTGERPYTCQRNQLNHHMDTHTGVRRFECDTCGRGFRQKHHLIAHSVLHTGEKKFTCQVCNVAFSYKVNLNNHVLKVHGVNLKFKSIHTVTEDVLRREIEMTSEARVAIAHILPAVGGVAGVPQPAAHETVDHDAEYAIDRL